MIKHYCDSCGAEVTDETGILKSKEITLELTEKKISVVIEIDTMDRKSVGSEGHPALCAPCLAMRLGEWGTSVIEARGAGLCQQ